MIGVQVIPGLSLFELVADGAQTLGWPLTSQRVKMLGEKLVAHFSDPTDRLPRLAAEADAHAWAQLGRTLDPRRVGWLRGLVEWLFQPHEDRAVRRTIRRWLGEATLPGVADRAVFLRDCHRELADARGRGLLTPDYSAATITGVVDALASLGDATISAARQRLPDATIVVLRGEGYGALASLLEAPLAGGQTLIGAVSDYYFRSRLASDGALFRRVLTDEIRKLGLDQARGFEALHRRFDRLEDELADERRRFREHANLYEAVAVMIREVGMERQELLQSHGGTVHTLHDRRRVGDFSRRVQSLPEEQRAHMPALANAVGKLLFAAENYPGALDLFRLAAGAADLPPPARAELEYNAYQAALAQEDFDAALAHLRLAAEADPDRAPFPIDRYVPVAILGAGGAGVVFHCRDSLAEEDVVVKAVRADGGAGLLGAMDREARALFRVRHPNVIEIGNLFYAGPGRARPYLTVRYFDGTSLDRHLGSTLLGVPDLLALAVPLAETFRDVHARYRVYHQDVKPQNLLVRRTEGGWEFKVIDFGLARILPPQDHPRTHHTQHLGGGTPQYAAPEQGPRSPVPVGPYTDVYGFGRLCCFALLGTPEPDRNDWRELEGLSAELARVLERCIEKKVQRRYQSFDELLPDLLRLRSSHALGTTTPDSTPTLGELGTAPPNGSAASVDTASLVVLTDPINPDALPDITLELDADKSAPEPSNTDPAQPAGVPLDPAGTRAPKRRRVGLWKKSPPPGREEAAVQRTRHREAQAKGLAVSALFAGFLPPPATGKPGSPPMGVVCTVRVRGGERPDHYPVPGDPGAVSLSDWIAAHDAPPNWSAARRLLAAYGLRLPTAKELADGIESGQIAPPTAPVWVREDRLRCYLPMGRVAFPGGAGEDARVLVAVGEGGVAKAESRAGRADPTRV